MCNLPKGIGDGRNIFTISDEIVNPCFLPKGTGGFEFGGIAPNPLESDRFGCEPKGILNHNAPANGWQVGDFATWQARLTPKTS